MIRPGALFLVLLLGVSTVPTAAGMAAALALGLDPAGLTAVLDTPGVWLSLASSVWTGIAATALALLLAHLAVGAAMTGGWRRRLNAFALPFLAMPHLAIGIGLLVLLAPSGLLLRLVSPVPSGFERPPDWLIAQDPLGLSLILGLVIKETAFIVLVLVAALSQVPAERLMQQARSLSYGRLKGWFVAVAPLLQRQIRLPLAAVLVFGVTNVEMAIPLGPDLPPTFAVMLWRWFTDADPAIHAQAYAGSLMLMAAAVLAVVLAGGAGRLAVIAWRSWAESGMRQPAERAARVTAGAALSAFWILGALAVLAIVLRSAGGPWRFPAVMPADADPLSAWTAAFPLAGAAATTTALLAVATAAIGVLLVMPAAEYLRHNASAIRATGALLFLPLLLPQMTFLFGVQVLLVRLRIDGTFAAVLWAHLIFALPYLWGILAPARAAIDPGYLNVARTLGAGPVRGWLTITAPLLLRATLLAMALAISVSVALYLPTLFAGSGRLATAATEAAAAAGSGTVRLAAANALVLALLPLLAFTMAYAASALVFRNRRDIPR